MARANIASAEILQRLRQAIILLTEEVERATSAANQDAARILDWLQQQQLPEARRSCTRQEQRVNEARIAYLAAKHQRSAAGPQPYEDVERSYRRATAQFEELQHRLHTITSSLTHLPRTLEQPLAALRRSSSRMLEGAQAAVARLDQMHDDLVTYQQQSDQ